MMVVLVVEDSPLLADLMQQILHSLDAEAVLAADVTSALHQLERRSDITHVITDLSLQDQDDGIELIDTIRRRWPRLPIIVTSGTSPPDTLPGDIPFMFKPYCITDLADWLTRLNGARSRP